MRWIRGNDLNSETELVSGSADGDTIVWNLNNQSYTLKGNSKNINIVDGLHSSEKQQNTIIVSVSLDSTIRIWFRHKIGGRLSLELNNSIIM